MKKPERLRLNEPWKKFYNEGGAPEQPRKYLDFAGPGPYNENVLGKSDYIERMLTVKQLPVDSTALSKAIDCFNNKWGFTVNPDNELQTFVEDVSNNSDFEPLRFSEDTESFSTPNVAQEPERERLSLDTIIGMGTTTVPTEDDINLVCEGAYTTKIAQEPKQCTNYDFKVGDKVLIKYAAKVDIEGVIIEDMKHGIYKVQFNNGRNVLATNKSNLKKVEEPLPEHNFKVGDKVRLKGHIIPGISIEEIGSIVELYKNGELLLEFGSSDKLYVLYSCHLQKVEESLPEHDFKVGDEVIIDLKYTMSLIKPYIKPFNKKIGVIQEASDKRLKVQVKGLEGSVYLYPQDVVHYFKTDDKVMIIRKPTNEENNNLIDPWLSYMDDLIEEKAIIEGHIGSIEYKVIVNDSYYSIPSYCLQKIRN